ncbi:MAG: ABC transporter permease [Candidatus Bipolaricaulia bacterium]
MVDYFIRRLFTLVVVLLLISIITFVILNAIPGDPALIILGVEADPDLLDRLREQLGLNRPLHLQYWYWISGVVKGDLGSSIHYSVPISSLIVSRLSVTLPLAALATVLAVMLSIPLGIYAATHQNRIGDFSSMVLSQLGLSVPSFWIGILLIILFAVHLGWFPAGGFTYWSENAVAALKSLLLPALALGVAQAAVLTRITRSSMLEVLHEDYIQTARSKGLAERVVIYKHGLKNAFISILTILGLQIGALLTGSIIIENVFSLPGLGRLVLGSIGQRDLPVVQGIVVFFAAMIILINFIVDILYGYLNPRIRYE